jgi:hypothetical protein
MDQQALRAGAAGAVGFTLIFGAAQLLRGSGQYGALQTLLVMIALVLGVGLGGALPCRALGYDWTLSIASAISSHCVALLVGFGIVWAVRFEVAWTLILVVGAITTMIVSITDRMLLPTETVIIFWVVSGNLLLLAFTIPIHHVSGALVGLLAWITLPMTVSLTLERKA